MALVSILSWLPYIEINEYKQLLFIVDINDVAFAENLFNLSIAAYYPLCFIVMSGEMRRQALQVSSTKIFISAFSYQKYCQQDPADSPV